RTAPGHGSLTISFIFQLLSMQNKRLLQDGRSPGYGPCLAALAWIVLGSVALPASAGAALPTHALSRTVQPVRQPVQGTVTDEKGAPLPGVTVQVKGTTQGTVTDAAGRFSMDVPEDAVLVISFIGYQSQEVAVGGRTAIDVQLRSSASGLNGVVVVGYGTQKKANLTGAVSQVTSDVLDQRSLPNLTQGVQGN